MAVVDFIVYRFIFDYTLPRTIFHVIFMSVFMGLLFYIVLPKLMNKIADRLLKSIPALTLLPDETIILEAGANHFKGVEGVGGRLTLTSHRLVFVSHKQNIQRHQQEFNRKSIVGVSPHKKFSKGIVVSTNEHDDHTFIVDSPEKWINEITA
jgi:hypothetical protein